MAIPEEIRGEGGLTDLAVLGPVGALGEQRRPDGTSDGDVRGVHDPYRSGFVKVFGIELDRVSFLVVRDVSDWRMDNKFSARTGE